MFPYSFLWVHCGGDEISSAEVWKAYVSEYASTFMAVSLKSLNYAFYTSYLRHMQTIKREYILSVTTRMLTIMKISKLAYWNSMS